jgi:hypothetical protein
MYFDICSNRGGLIKGELGVMKATEEAKIIKVEGDADEIWEQLLDELKEEFAPKIREVIDDSDLRLVKSWVAQCDVNHPIDKIIVNVCAQFISKSIIEFKKCYEHKDEVIGGDIFLAVYSSLKDASHFIRKIIDEGRKRNNSSVN